MTAAQATIKYDYIFVSEDWHYLLDVLGYFKVMYTYCKNQVMWETELAVK